MAALTVVSDVDRALCRSALWEALALGFRPPTAEGLGRLASPEGARALADAVAVFAGGGDHGLVPLVVALGDDPAGSVDALRATYGRLFGHTARGRVPPYETEYGEDSLWEPQREMSDLAAFWRAFGLLLRQDAGERPDHIACQCEFMLVLGRKEAHALEQADPAMFEVTSQAARLFLRDHLGRWGPAFGATLARDDPGGFYGTLGRLCAAFVVFECGRVGVTAGPEFLRLRSVETAEIPSGCGSPMETLRE